MVKLFAVLSLVFISGCGRGLSDRVVLRFWHGIESPENNRLLEKKVRLFEERNPDIKIELENIGAQDRAMPRIMTALSAGRQPDLLWFAPVYTGRIAESGKLFPAEKFIEKDTGFDPSKIYEGILDTGRYNGVIYTVPFETNCLAVYYNKDHFQEAGITELPRTWEDLRDTAIKITEHSAESDLIERFGMLIPLGTEEWTVWTWQTFLWQAGGDILDDTMTVPRFDSQEGIRALQYWIDLIHKYECAVFSERNAGYKLDPFLAGRVSMMINGPWNYPVLQQQDTVNYGSFPLPGDKKQATNIGGENLYIFRSTAPKEAAAWEFAKFIMSEEFQVEWAINTGYLPVNRLAAESAEYRQFLEENPFIKTFVDSMEFGRARPPVKEYSRISDRIGRAIESALYLRVSPVEALRKAAQEAGDLL